MFLKIILVLVFINIRIAYSREYLLQVKSNTPAIKGSIVTFTADLLEINGTIANVGDSPLKWVWLIDGHGKQEFQTNVPNAKWSIKFNQTMNKAYKVEVNVGQRYLFFDYTLASSSLKVNITTMLNGEMHLSQNGAEIKSTNISTDVPVEHKLEIRKEDFDSIANASSTVVHWFVDCQYVRQTKELKTQHIFSEPNKTHRLEALIEASFEPAIIKTTPTLKSKLISDWRSQHKSNWPYICNNQSKIIPNQNQIYGHFERTLTAFDPITDLLVNGSSWINDGDNYQLNIFCTGSPNFEYCIHQIDGPYILNGNETCDEWTTLEECQQNLNFTQSVLNVKSFSPFILVATVVGTIVFTLCVIAAVVFCSIQYFRQKKSASIKSSTQSDAESKLIRQKPNKMQDTNLMPNKIHG